VKTGFKNSSLLPVLFVVVLGLPLTWRVRAQTFSVIHTFTGIGSDGAKPSGGLILSGNRLYGTTGLGGLDSGTVFAFNTDGTGFTNLYSFLGFIPPYYTNGDGAYPEAPLTLASNTLYGTTVFGGGTVFAINTDGSGFTNLYSFVGKSGSGDPEAALTLSGNTLYGTTSGAGFDWGTVFAINTDGSSMKTLHSFTNTDGAGPSSELILLGMTLYGTTESGGSSGSGTLFAINTNGTGFTTLYNFSGATGPQSTNGDGAGPGHLLLSGNTLYGTAVAGGSSGKGTVFKVAIDGTGFKNLHNFTQTEPPINFINSDGVGPLGGLVLLGNTLYGTTVGGGSFGDGTIFKVHIDGSGFATLHSFNGNDDGTDSSGLLAVSQNTLYGTTYTLGSAGQGTVYSLSLLPELTIAPSGAKMILTWPTNFTGYTLQSATNITSPIWTTNFLTPTVVNGQNTLTNPVSATQQFFRLSQ
jgi:uncharacterized repeat protein (TIGR03803 family)